MKKEQNSTVVVFTFRYIWKTKDEKMCVKYYTDTPEAHERFMQALREDDTVLSALREYISEVNFAFIGFTEEVKKEVTNDEKV